MKSALITGITGQDGSYLAELLLEKGYRVHGLVRRCSSSNLQRIAHIKDRLVLHEGDLNDLSSLYRTLESSFPDEIYNLAAMSHVMHSFEMPEYTADVDGLGVLRLLEVMKQSCPHARFYQASTSELFGKALVFPQNENTPFHPRSPYGIAKLYAYWTVLNYREAYGMYTCNGILFNHESPRRGENFVSRKIAIAAVKIKQGLQEKLTLGNLQAKRDWGYAKDFVEGMWLMLQQERPEDYVLATGRAETVRRFVELTFQEVDIEITWEDEGLQEVGRDKHSGKLLIDISPLLFRPAEVDSLVGDAAKARERLGWAPKTGLEDLVKLMVEWELNRNNRMVRIEE